jgi:hypothetical protein
MVEFVMPGHSMSALRRLRKLVCAAGHPRLDSISARKDVDARDEPGHDEEING